jgi:hypothetical protein
MKFDTYIPCDILKPFVKSFAVQETTKENTYKVLPDTGLVIGFQYKGKLSRLQNETETPLSISGVSGLADHSITFKNSPDIGTVLIFFKYLHFEKGRSDVSFKNITLFYPDTRDWF